MSIPPSRHVFHVVKRALCCRTRVLSDLFSDLAIDASDRLAGRAYLLRDEDTRGSAGAANVSPYFLLLSLLGWLRCLLKFVGQYGRHRRSCRRSSQPLEDVRLTIAHWIRVECKEPPTDGDKVQESLPSPRYPIQLMDLAIAGVTFEGESSVCNCFCVRKLRSRAVHPQLRGT